MKRIRFKLAAVTAAVALLLGFSQPQPALGEHGFFGGYVGIDADSGGNTWYGLDQPGANFLTAFDGLDFGIVSSLVISGGEGLTFKNGGDDVTGVNLNYRVYPTIAPGGSFTFISLGFTTDQPFNDAASNPFSTDGDQKWAEISATPDVALPLGPGNYTLEVYLSGFSPQGDFFLNNFAPGSPDTALGGAAEPPNYKATFEIVPEPTTFLLVAASLASAFVLRRRP